MWRSLRFPGQPLLSAAAVLRPYIALWPALFFHGKARLARAHCFSLVLEYCRTATRNLAVRPTCLPHAFYDCCRCIGSRGRCAMRHAYGNFVSLLCYLKLLYREPLPSHR
ncbi:uncharacterized protein B0H18DRAFT_113487 [Fomitopsis serialis]|uniref:uncharacterized protein n=1 Tax=Fomitopsis serialis TaxID=139415 RepID=UPI0020089AD4|nr:uncharacterized protein B0H18DRAFT_113487 [Neoantrodia serialis]KAH9914985.1 hypothetical protein B0H18DRAFT_113487 [Neoantrodia serialis]